MTGLTLLINYQAHRELEIRRRFRSDPVFREVCDDLETAETARLQWLGNDAHRAGDYERLVRDLRDELFSMLGPDRAHTSKPAETNNTSS